MKIVAGVLTGAVLVTALFIAGLVLWVEYQAFIGSNPFQ